MSWLKWAPWRWMISRIARSHGFIDPIALLARLHRFAQPSEVAEPVELLRAGVVFHARGLINSRVIQHNLDWVWPFWIERQFSPRDVAFIPRAFSITHINLTHRNWTAIGYPDCPELPIVDPRGLLTPFYDGWSLDGWLLTEDGRCLFPSRADTASQQQELDQNLRVSTEIHQDDLWLHSCAMLNVESGHPVCILDLQGRAAVDGWLVLALRPQNPEGISFIHEVRLSATRMDWTVDGRHKVCFSKAAQHHHVSDYRQGDVAIHLRDMEEQAGGTCDVGLITAAALFPLRAGEDGRIRVRIPLPAESSPALPDDRWQQVRRDLCQLECPDPPYQSLFDAAIASLILHAPGDVYPGPYTYKRFWFRDAAFIIHALLCTGLIPQAERALLRFPERQTLGGYFHSQEGEWDSNGEVLWILQRFRQITNRVLPAKLQSPVLRGARWILRKRVDVATTLPHAGLLPAGFSAEHLGPNDYYFWDDFWAIAGLRAAAALCADFDEGRSAGLIHGAEEFETAVERSLARCEERLGRPAMPASPYRRLDAGAIGSLVTGYPLQLYPSDDPRLLDTVEFLLQNCFLDDAFFQDMIHSGHNAYLTLHVAQVLLRNGDARYLRLMDAVAALASTTGQWPEAIHPQTGGGCMGDGHHVWASAEWLLMIRHCFVREEGAALILGAGVPERWLRSRQPIRFGPAPTSFGPVSISIEPLAAEGRSLQMTWRGDWHGTGPPAIEIRLPGYVPVQLPAQNSSPTNGNDYSRHSLTRLTRMKP